MANQPTFPIATSVFERVRAMEAEHAQMRAALDSLRGRAAVDLAQYEALAAENARLRAELAERSRGDAYRRWFAETFRVDLPTPNTWPFTTWGTGTPWGDKIAFGMQDGEILFAEHLLETLEAEGVEGAIVEYGTYYGHWVQVLAETLERRGWSREVWGFDSFEGLPEPEPGTDNPMWTRGLYTAPFEEVKARLQVEKRPWLRLVKGWFGETLRQPPATGIGPIAYARIDGDLYSSCVDCLAHLMPRLPRGGILVFDDWQFELHHGETRAFREWIEANPGWRFEFLGMNLWAHLYLRVLERP